MNNIVVLYTVEGDQFKSMRESFQTVLNERKDANTKVYFVQMDEFFKIDMDLYVVDAVVYLDFDCEYRPLKDFYGIIFNENTRLYPCCDKTAFAYRAAKVGIPSIKSYDNPPETYPFIAKGRNGSGGKSVFLIEKKEDLDNLPPVNIGYLYQDFITTSLGVDYRTVVINHKVVYVQKRFNENSFKSNVNSGGSCCDAEIPDSWKEMAEEASRKLNLDFVGFDLLDNGDGTAIICEANNKPHYSKTDTINIYDKYAEFILDSVNKGYK